MKLTKITIFCMSLTAMVMLSACHTTNTSVKRDASGVEMKSIDPGVKPCTNFYQYACGYWMKNNPIPSDESSWDRFGEVHKHNREILKSLLEQKGSLNEEQTKLSHYYSACMDQTAIDDKGLEPLQPYFTAINNINNKAQFATELARLQKQGVNAIFWFGSEPDFQKPSLMMAWIDQGGLSLPDTNDYLSMDPTIIERRAVFKDYVAKMFGFTDDPDAAQDAAIVLRVETALAKISMTKEEKRQPDDVHHRESLVDLESKLTPHLDWAAYFSEMKAPEFTQVDVQSLKFFEGLNELLESIPMADWKVYLRWQVINVNTQMLPEQFEQASFNFYDKYLNGQDQQKPRWRICVWAVDNGMGEALGHEFVNKEFKGNSKRTMLAMIKNIDVSMKKTIEQATWMSPETKKKALKKLSEMNHKIGYPDHWRDYSQLRISPTDAFANTMKATELEMNRQLAKIGKPTDKTEWWMTPPTVNAYYDASANDINFPAGILQRPFFNKDNDAAVNYGGIGVVIGHEITHGFDDEGSKYDGHGALKDWWTPQDRKSFEASAAGLSKQYSTFTVKDADGKDLPINGKLTNGENIADNGGIRLAYNAYMSTHPHGNIDGLTPQQRFFLGFAQVWCSNEKPESVAQGITNDPHSPPQWRVNGTVSNMPQFQQAFSCKMGDPMVSANPQRVW